MPNFLEQYETKDTETKDTFDQESMENLVEFFELLLEVDMRVNPQNYKANTSKNIELIAEPMDKSGQ